MLDDIDRLVDLTGRHVTRDPDILDALSRGDDEPLVAAPGHLAASGQHGRMSSLARIIGVPLWYFVAKMYHGPFLVVAERIDRLFDWCVEQRIAWQFDPAYTRMVPAHHVVEIDQAGCP